MENSHYDARVIKGILKNSTIADLSNLIDWSYCNALPTDGECPNLELFASRLRVGPPITIKSPRLFLYENAEIMRRMLEDTELCITAWSRYRHENVLELFGIAQFRGHLALVIFGGQQPTLPKYLEMNPNADRLQLSFQVASGLAYLHSLDEAHRGVKASNVIVDANSVAKLGGFDLIYDNLTINHSTSSIDSFLWWMMRELHLVAPEQLLGAPAHNLETNVYALGMTILEVFTGKWPYAEVPSFAVLINEVATKKALPRRPFWLTPGRSDIDNQLWQLLLSCWAREPKARPAASYIQRRILALHQEYLENKSLRVGTSFIQVLSSIMIAMSLGLQNNVSDTSPSHVTIESAMSASDVIVHLTAHQCPDITSTIDFSGCADKPTFGGGFSDVYKRLLLDGTQVAIKCLRLFTSATVYNTKYAARELYAWSKLTHENVIELLGLVLFRGQIAMVSPWMAQGSLPTYAASTPKADRYDLCAQVAEGLAYIHSQGIVHGDVKGANILVSQNGTAKLTDFGNTTLKQETTVQFTITASHNISLRWAAPELLTDERDASFASDVYALGMTTLEVLSGEMPYHDKRDTVVMHLVIIRRAFPERPMKVIPSTSNAANSLWSLLKKTWSYSPEDRPSVGEVRDLMKQLANYGI